MVHSASYTGAPPKPLRPHATRWTGATGTGSASAATQPWDSRVSPGLGDERTRMSRRLGSKWSEHGEDQRHGLAQRLCAENPDQSPYAALEVIPAPGENTL